MKKILIITSLLTLGCFIYFSPVSMATEYEINSRQASIAVWDDTAYIGGTTRNDMVYVGLACGSNELLIWINGELHTLPMPSRVAAYLGEGNDFALASEELEIPVMFYGQSGDDHLRGGGGHDILLGGDGDDMIIGRKGRDLLIGGQGADHIVGNPDDDILIAGDLSYSDPDELVEVMEEWTSSNDYYDRLANLSDNCDYCLIPSGSDATVLDDEAGDLLTGSTGQDWFFANLEGGVLDKITGLQDDEFAEDLD